jgi:hypothetical protein
VAISWSLLTLVFSGKFSASITGSLASGGLKITSAKGVTVSVVGSLVIRTANGNTFQVSVGIARNLGRYIGVISVSGPGVRTIAVVNSASLDVSNGLVTGEGGGFNGTMPYSLSFTL